MEGGENNEGQGFSSPASQQQGWSNMSSPAQDLQSKTGDIPVYFNTQDAPASNPPTSYPQSQNSPAISQAGSQVSTGQNYPDAFVRYQPHVQSPGPGRPTHRVPGPYAVAPGWPNSNSPAPTHPPYMSPDRGRPLTRPPYPGFDPSKSYPHTPQTGQHQWQRAPYPSPHPAYNADHMRMNRYGQPDIAGPVLPAGLQALQANNNNATLMQHQHTPMLVPNPHYNQNRAQGPSLDNKMNEMPKSEQQHTPQRPPSMNPMPDGSMFSPSSTNAPTSGYYPTPSPLAAQHSNLGPMHHQMGLSSPRVSPYPVNPSTPGSGKGKARGNKCYQCPKCVKIFRRGDHLKRHLLSVHDHEHPYQCGECGKGFASVPALLKHAKSLHVGQMAKGLMCLRCHITFVSLQEIETHANSLHVQEDEIYMQNINTSSKQHSCTACPKSFTSAANLKRHMQLLHRSKDDTKMFCRECGKSFARIDGLRKHVDKTHNGNPNAMPPADELDDSETLSQAHSSESESRGPSADADESSVPAPPANTQWGGYSLPTTQQPTDPRAGGQAHGQALIAPPPGPAYQQQYQPPAMNNQPAVVGAPQPPPPTSTTISLPAQKPPEVHIPETKAEAKISQDLNSAVTSVTQVQNGVLSNHATTVSSDHTLMEPIEPKSVSEALSMAMKALSDFDYETPGFEMYPYPTADPHFAAHVHQNRMQMHQHQMLLPPLGNGISQSINGPRPHNAAPPQGMIGYNNSYDFSRHSGNFLMTVPPPPGSMTMGRLLPQPVTVAGVSEAPQLSQLLQEGGGGVKIPTTINNNNNSNSKKVAPHFGVQEKVPTAHIGAKFYVSDDAGSPDSGQQQSDSSSGEKVELICTICKTEYNTIDELMGHIEGVHLKQNPHECCMCKKHFAQAGNVKRHIRFVHLRERPFRCKDCSCTFDRLCYLQRHMRTHLQLSEENQEFNPLKPCTCPECGKRCLTAHHLRGHMQRKHFAKNKQKYDKFLAKYGHLEALGNGPGALTNPKGRKGRKKKQEESESIANNFGFLENEMYNAEYPNNSSPIPDSSIHPNALSNFPRYQCAPPQKIPPAIHLPTESFIQPPQPNVETGIQLSTGNGNNLEHLNTNPEFGQSIMGFQANMVVQNQHTSNAGINCSEGINPVPNQNVLHFDTAQFVVTTPVLKKDVKATKISVKSRSKSRRNQKLLPFRCTHCVLKSFSSLAMLRSHVYVAHKKYLKRHACRKCGESFTKRSYLLSHANEVHSQRKRCRRAKKIRNIAIGSNVQMSTVAPSTTPPSYQAQQPRGYTQNIGYYPHPAHPYYSYDPNSPAMVPSPNVQMAYSVPSHHMPSQMPLIQT